MPRITMSSDLILQAITEGKVRCNISSLNSDRPARVSPSEIINILRNNVDRVNDPNYRIDPISNLSAAWKTQ
jgi:hypothetical protein